MMLDNKHAILGFTGRYHFLSNFYPCIVNHGCLSYPSSEHAYQACKTKDRGKRLAFTDLSIPPNQAKKMGRKLILREDWEEIKIAVMRDILQCKFSDMLLKKALLDTGEAYLEEMNWWGDTFWGVCNGKGENHLGKLLMELRSNHERLLV